MQGKKKEKNFHPQEHFCVSWQPSVRELTYFELHPFIFIRTALLPSHAVILLSYGWTQTHRECHRVFTAISELDSFRPLHNMWGLCRSEMEPEWSHQALNAPNSPGQAALLRLPPPVRSVSPLCRRSPGWRSTSAVTARSSPQAQPIRSRFLAALKVVGALVRALKKVSTLCAWLSSSISAWNENDYN